jgi:hypothetical protein
LPNSNVLTFDNLIDIDIKAEPQRVENLNGKDVLNPFDVKDLLDLPIPNADSN